MKRKPRKTGVKKTCEKNIERKRYCSLFTGENGKRAHRAENGKKMERKISKREMKEKLRKKKLV